MGGGRKPVSKYFTQALLNAFEELFESNGGGNPVTSDCWTYLSITEIRILLQDLVELVSRKTIKKLLKHYKIGRRQIAKTQTMKMVEISSLRKSVNNHHQRWWL